MPERLIRIAHHSSLASIFAHIFCCGLPALAALASLISGAGVAGMTMFHEFAATIESWHPYLFGFSTLMLGVAFFGAWMAARRDCADASVTAEASECDCCHDACTPVKQKSTHRVLLIAIIVYAVNAIAFFIVG